jgi:hypothetical protein
MAAKNDLLFETTFASFFKEKKVVQKSQSSRNQGVFHIFFV